MGFGINDLDLYISKKVRFLRKQRGWKLKALASELNLSIQQLQKYETAVNKISASLLYEIAAVFKVPIAYFYEGFKAEISPQKDDGANILLISNDIESEIILRDAIVSFPKKSNIYSINVGNQALEFIKAFSRRPIFVRPDLILLESYIPKATSVDILKLIKKEKILLHVPVIIVTNNANYEDIKISYELNVSGYIVKSPSIKELKNQIHQLLNYWLVLVKLAEVNI